MTKKQKEIIQTSIELFYRLGYIETSVRDIATAVQLKPASLYSHFESKEQILRNICDDVQSRFYKISIELEESKIEPKELFKYFLKRHIEELFKNPKAFSIYQKHGFIVDENSNTSYVASNLAYQQLLERILNAILIHEVVPKSLQKNTPTFIALQVLNNFHVLINYEEELNVEEVAHYLQMKMFYGFLQE